MTEINSSRIPYRKNPLRNKSTNCPMTERESRHKQAFKIKSSAQPFDDITNKYGIPNLNNVQRYIQNLNGSSYEDINCKSSTREITSSTSRYNSNSNKIPCNSFIKNDNGLKSRRMSFLRKKSDDSQERKDSTRSSNEKKSRKRFIYNPEELKHQITMQKLSQQYEDLIIEEKAVVENLKKTDAVKKEIHSKKTKLESLDKQIETLKTKENNKRKQAQENISRQKNIPEKSATESPIKIDIGNLQRSIDILKDFVELEGLEFNDRSEIFESYFDKITDANEFYDPAEENYLQPDLLQNNTNDKESKIINTISSTNNSLGFCEHPVNMEILNTFASENNENLMSLYTNIDEYMQENKNFKLKDEFYNIKSNDNNEAFLEKELELLKMDYELLQQVETNDIVTPDFNNQVINFENKEERNLIQIDENPNFQKICFTKHEHVENKQSAQKNKSNFSYEEKSQPESYNVNRCSNNKGEVEKKFTTLGGSTRDRTKFDSTDHKTNNPNQLETYENYFDTNIYKKSEDDLKLSSRIDNSVFIAGRFGESNKVEDELLRELEGGEQNKRHKNVPIESPMKFESTDCKKLISVKGNKKQIDKNLIYLTLDHVNQDDCLFSQENYNITSFNKLPGSVDCDNKNMFSEHNRNNFQNIENLDGRTKNRRNSREKEEFPEFGLNQNAPGVENQILDYDNEAISQLESIKNSNYELEKDLNSGYDIAGAKTDRHLDKAPNNVAPNNKNFFNPNEHHGAHIDYIKKKPNPNNIKKYKQENELRVANNNLKEGDVNEDVPLYTKYKKVAGFGFFPLKNQDYKGCVSRSSPKQNPRLKIDTSQNNNFNTNLSQSDYNRSILLKEQKNLELKISKNLTKKQEDYNLEQKKIQEKIKVHVNEISSIKCSKGSSSKFATTIKHCNKFNKTLQISSQTARPKSVSKDKKPKSKREKCPVTYRINQADTPFRRPSKSRSPKNKSFLKNTSKPNSPTDKKPSFLKKRRMLKNNSVDLTNNNHKDFSYLVSGENKTKKSRLSTPKNKGQNGIGNNTMVLNQNNRFHNTLESKESQIDIDTNFKNSTQNPSRLLIDSKFSSRFNKSNETRGATDVKTNRTCVKQADTKQKNIEKAQKENTNTKNSNFCNDLTGLGLDNYENNQITGSITKAIMEKFGSDNLKNENKVLDVKELARQGNNGYIERNLYGEKQVCFTNRDNYQSINPDQMDERSQNILAYSDEASMSNEYKINYSSQRMLGDSVQSSTTFLWTNISSEDRTNILNIKKLYKIKTRTFDGYIKSIQFFYLLKSGREYRTQEFCSDHIDIDMQNDDDIQADTFELAKTDAIDSIISGFRDGFKYIKVITCHNKVCTFGESVFDLRTRVLEMEFENRELHYISGGFNDFGNLSHLTFHLREI